MKLIGTQRINELGHLEVGGCDSVDLARSYGTPLFVIDEELVRENCRRYKDAFSKHYPTEARVAYAAKAFITTAMCKLIYQEGVWLDVSSGGELYTAIVSGFPPNRIYLHGNYKTDEELKYALDVGVYCIVADSVDELHVLNSLARSLRRKTVVMLRVTPGVEAHTHEYIRTGQVDTKFGIPLAYDQALNATKLALSMDWIELVGFHCHIGSQVFEIEPYRITIELMIEFAAQVASELGFVFKELNLGGGLGVRYTEEDDPPTIEDFIGAVCEAIMNECKRYSLPLPTLVVEPGRSIVGEAGLTLYTIGVVKEIPGVRVYVSVDGGMSDNPRPALYGARYSAIIANKASQQPNLLCTVVGRHCEADVLIRDIYLADPKRGDILAVFCTGAYHYSMASNYNRFPRPAVVLVKDGDSDLIVKRESWEDLIRNDVIPLKLLDRDKP
ncbi:MAG: diaminopimelate decarboxylase [Armatimonadota bacterium]|nr:diaminopimelate decarboxylase [Armatimonadota bacterium]MCX7777920.1 diaminopimelate decarboxylase [Armatimonadota bacterium]MDW8026492.1 diaminopimelate decarboxylase [Armatimonadota bacterium]